MHQRRSLFVNRESLVRLSFVAVTLAASMGSRSPQTPVDPRPGGPPSTATLRFHHFHYRAGDPSEAMRHAADMFQGMRVLLRGLGVGVRVGDEYVLFDRTDASELHRCRRQPAGNVLRNAVEWLRLHGFPPPGGGANSRRAQSPTSFRGLPLDHVAFMAPDLPRAVARFRERSAIPIRENGGFGAIPRARWNHDRNRPRHGCARCVLVPDAPRRQIRRGRNNVRCAAWRSSPCPPPVIGEYRMDVVATRAALAPASRSCA